MPLQEQLMSAVLVTKLFESFCSPGGLFVCGGSMGIIIMMRQLKHFYIFQVYVCGISSNAGPLITSTFQTAARSWFLQVVLHRRGGDYIHEMMCLFVLVGLNAPFIVLRHWNNIS